MKNPNSKKNVFTIAALVIILFLVVMLAFDLFPLFKATITHLDNESEMVNYIQHYGIKGAPIIAGLQTLQVFVPFFPAAAVQLLAGLCYGVWLGTLICLVGYVAGNLMVFVLVRQFRKNLDPFFENRKKGKHSSFLDLEKIKQMKDPYFTSFMLYLIPGIPNGLLPYVFAQTDITFPQFLLSITAASVPSMLLCTLIGDLINSRNYSAAIALGLLAGIALALLLLNRKKIIEMLNHLHFGEDSK